MAKLAQKYEKIQIKVIDLKRLFSEMNLFHMRIYCNKVNCKVDFKNCVFHSLKGSEIHTKYITLNNSIS